MMSNRQSQGLVLSDLIAERNDLRSRISSLDKCVSQLELDNKLMRKENEHLNKLLHEKDSHIHTLKSQCEQHTVEEMKEETNLKRESIEHIDYQETISQLNEQLKFCNSEIYRLSWAHQDADFLINRLRRTIDEVNQQSLQHVSTIASLETNLLSLCSNDSIHMELEEEKETLTSTTIVKKNRETVVRKRDISASESDVAGMTPDLMNPDKKPASTSDADIRSDTDTRKSLRTR